jgi:tetratricopeptide (TPR) repeat protein
LCQILSLEVDGNHAEIVRLFEFTHHRRPDAAGATTFALHRVSARTFRTYITSVRHFGLEGQAHAIIAQACAEGRQHLISAATANRVLQIWDAQGRAEVIEQEALQIADVDAREDRLLEALRVLLRLDPDVAQLDDIDGSRAAIMVQMGRLERLRGQSQAAHVHLQDAARLAPWLSTTMLELARLQRGDGDFEQAIQSYREFLHMDYNRDVDEEFRRFELRDSFMVLGLPTTATLEETTARWMALRIIRHPNVPTGKRTQSWRACSI